MRRVLLVSPHFPPDSSAAAHRVRLLAPYLEEFGWRPTVMTVAASSYEGRLDPRLEALVPATLDIVRADAWSARITRRMGLGDLGLRALTGLRRGCRTALGREPYDLLFITTYPVYPALLGPMLKREFSVPFVLDYQDPWVGSWGRTVGGGRNGQPDWKSRASRLIATRLEPYVISSADALTAVSQGTLDGVVRRIPEAAGLPHAVIPVGFESSDFAQLPSRSRPAFCTADGLRHLVYVGTLLPNGRPTLELLFRALALARSVDPAARRLRIHAFGTSNQSDGDRLRVVPVASACGVADVVTEHPGRLDYFDALATLENSSAILLLGSSERHYTASKLYPALLARRPILALFHEASSVASILRDVGREPTVAIVTYADDVVTDDRMRTVARHLSSLASNCQYADDDVDFSRVAEFSAKKLARRLAAIFDRVAA